MDTLRSGCHRIQINAARCTDLFLYYFLDSYIQHLFNPPVNLSDYGLRLRALRARSSLSVRQLAARSGVSPGMVSLVERGQTTPSLTTVHKLLCALGTDLGTFFSGDRPDQAGPVYLREQMKTLRDQARGYALVFPRRADIALQLFDETLNAGKRPEFETLTCDIGGYILAGTMTLAVKGQPARQLRPGDAFYLPKGTTHRGYAAGDEPVRLISFCCPADY